MVAPVGGVHRGTRRRAGGASAGSWLACRERLSRFVKLEATSIKVNLVSPGFANLALVKFEGTESVEDAVREVVRVARLGPRGPTGTFTT